jgi:hypothetical protein
MRRSIEHSDNYWDNEAIYLWRFHTDCLRFERFWQNWQHTAE